MKLVVFSASLPGWATAAASFITAWTRRYFLSLSFFFFFLFFCSSLFNSKNRQLARYLWSFDVGNVALQVAICWGGGVTKCICVLGGGLSLCFCVCDAHLPYNMLTSHLLVPNEKRQDSPNTAVPYIILPCSLICSQLYLGGSNSIQVSYWTETRSVFFFCILWMYNLWNADLKAECFKVILVCKSKLSFFPGQGKICLLWLSSVSPLPF